MTRRAERRRFAILGALAEHGPANASELCQLLHRASATIYPDLAALEADGRVVAKWATAGSPRRRLYRLPSPQERAARLALEERLRGTLRAAVEPLEGDRGAFWDDLNRRMADPAFRNAYEKQTRKLTRNEENDRG